MEYLYTILLLSACLLAIQCANYGDGSVAADFDVYCTDSAIRVYFDKKALGKRDTADNNRPYTIAWKNYKSQSACRVDSTSTANIDKKGVEKAAQRTTFEKTIWIEAKYPNDCGLVETQNADYINYKATAVVDYGINPASGIRRLERDSYEVSCNRDRTIIQKITNDQFDTAVRINGKETKSSTADYSFTLSHTDNNGAALTEYKIGDTIKFDLVFNTDLSTVKAVVQSCWSTSDGSNDEYKLIDSRCGVDRGTTLGAISEKSTKWTTEAYRYSLQNSASNVYIECSVNVCLITNDSGECQTCADAAGGGVGDSGKRKRRDIKDDQFNGTMVLVRSPVFYIIEKEQPTQGASQSSSSVLEGTNGSIIIVLLATLVFIIAVVLIKRQCFPTLVAVRSDSTNENDNQGLA